MRGWGGASTVCSCRPRASTRSKSLATSVAFGLLFSRFVELDANVFGYSDGSAARGNEATSQAAGRTGNAKHEKL